MCDTIKLKKLIVDSWLAAAHEAHAMSFGLSSSFERVFLAASGLGLLIREMGASASVLDSFLQQFCSFFLTLNEKDCIAAMKYCFAAPTSILLENELPPKPEKVWIWEGVFKRWMWERVRPAAYCRKNVWFCYSWLQGKRCTAQVSDEFLLSNYEKHRALLTSEFKDLTGRTALGPSGEVLSGGDIVRRCLAPVLKELNDEIVENYAKVQSSIGRTQPAASACYGNSRVNGGQHGEVLKGPRHTGFTGQYWLEPARMVYRHVVSCDNETVWGYCAWEYDLGEWCYQDIRERMLARVLLENSIEGFHASAEIMGILEPLKVRTISKGDHWAYYYSKSFQKLLHSTLKTKQPFRLIGRPCNVMDIADVYEKSLRAYRAPRDRRLGNLLHFSIDYSNATDGMDGDLSEFIMKGLVENLPEEDQKIYLRVLGNHNLEYPDVGGVKLEPGLQKRGQLMGSILSFPVLCLANYGVYLAVKSLGIGGKMFTPVSEKSVCDQVLVNGDDMYYMEEEDKWEVQNWISSSVGLEPSVGKAYIHERYVNINSTCYDTAPFGACYQRVVREEGSGQISNFASGVVKIPYLPLGLMHNIHKVQTDEVSKTPPSVAVLGKVIEGSRDSTMACRLTAHMFKKYALDYSRDLRGRNVFIHQSLGGEGIEPPIGFKVNFTKDQFKLADSILEKDVIPAQYPAKGQVFGVVGDPYKDITENTALRPAAWRKKAGVNKGLDGKFVVVVVPTITGWEMIPEEERDRVFKDVRVRNQISQKRQFSLLFHRGEGVAKRLLRIGVVPGRAFRVSSEFGGVLRADWL